MSLSKRQADQVSTAVLLIGLGLLLAHVLPFWPGIMFVIGAACIARGFAEGQGWYALQGGIWLIGLGFVFLNGFSLPLLFVLIGISMLVGNVFRPPSLRRDKLKNEDLLAADEHEPVADEFELGDDGELIKVKNDAKLVAEKGSQQ